MKNLKKIRRLTMRRKFVFLRVLFLFVLTFSYIYIYKNAMAANGKMVKTKYNDGNIQIDKDGSVYLHENFYKNIKNKWVKSSGKKFLNTSDKGLFLNEDGNARSLIPYQETETNEDVFYGADAYLFDGYIYFTKRKYANDGTETEYGKAYRLNTDNYALEEVTSEYRKNLSNVGYVDGKGIVFCGRGQSEYYSFSDKSFSPIGYCTFIPKYIKNGFIKYEKYKTWYLMDYYDNDMDEDKPLWIMDINTHEIKEITPESGCGSTMVDSKVYYINTNNKNDKCLYTYDIKEHEGQKVKVLYKNKELYAKGYIKRVEKKKLYYIIDAKDGKNINGNIRCGCR